MVWILSNRRMTNRNNVVNFFIKVLKSISMKSHKIRQPTNVHLGIIKIFIIN